MDATGFDDGRKGSWRRKRLGRTLVVSVLGLVAVTFLWDAHGAAEMTSRRSSLVVMSELIKRQAEELGRYPDSLQDVPGIVETFIPRGETTGLRYVAAGAAYDPEGNRLLLFEQTATRYGFRKGWFEVRQQEVLLRRGNPDLTAP